MKKTVVPTLILLSLMTLGLVSERPIWVNSQTNVTTFATLTVEPNPDVIGQIVTFSASIQPSPPSSADVFHNLTINATLPDGLWEWFGPYTSSSNGSISFRYIPTEIGNFTMVLNFPGELFANNNLFYLASGNQTTLTVLIASTPTPSPPPNGQITPTPSPSSPTPSPTPTPTSTTTVPATTDNGSIVDLAIIGNITSSQMPNVTIATNPSANTTKVSFTVTGESGTAGFSNITIPISAVPYGTAPTIYIDGQTASNQGYTQDSNNYYVWYTTSFSTHQVSIVFATTSSPSPSPTLSSTQAPFPIVAVAAVSGASAVAVVGAGLLVYFKKRKH